MANLPRVLSRGAAPDPYPPPRESQEGQPRTQTPRGEETPEEAPQTPPQTPRPSRAEDLAEVSLAPRRQTLTHAADLDRLTLGAFPLPYAADPSPSRSPPSTTPPLGTLEERRGEGEGVRAIRHGTRASSPGPGTTTDLRRTDATPTTSGENDEGTGWIWTHNPTTVHSRTCSRPLSLRI